MKKGISFTLVLIVSALVLLITATVLTVSSQGILGQFTDFLEGGSPTETDEIRSYCSERKIEACQNLEPDSREWAEEVTIEGRTCMEWAEEENIFGNQGAESIPPC